METKPELFYFKDDGNIPNSKLPLAVYRNAFSARQNAGASWLEKIFESNNWTNGWRNGIFRFHHYHSTSHEVLGIYAGDALLHLGGEKGEKVQVTAGDIIIIPAGVGHKNIESTKDFAVVGAYPDGMDYDLLRGESAERPQADHNITKVPIPEFDPLLGKHKGISRIWGA